MHKLSTCNGWQGLRRSSETPAFAKAMSTAQILLLAANPGISGLWAGIWTFRSYVDSLPRIGCGELLTQA